MIVRSRWTHTLRASLATVLLLGTPLAHAAGIALQNVNYAKSDRKVIVKGRLDGFAGATTVTLRNLATGQVMAGATAKGNQFGFHVNVPLGVQVPCEISVEARNASYTAHRTSEVRNAAGICGKYTVALTGVVTDTVIPFATVTVTVGGVTYTTVADENGQYTLPITSANLDELVLIEADGTSPATGEPIQFMNLIGSFSRVLDEQLTEGSADGNVTNVTTASYALLLEANGGDMPTTEEELRAAETSVDATALLQLAALIKLIVDDPDYSLPEGQTSLLEFVRDPVAVAQYLDTVPQSDLDAAITSILTDANLVPGFVAADIPSRYYAIPAAHPGYLARSGYILEFDSGAGTGRLLDFNSTRAEPINEPFAWSIQDGRLLATLPEPAARVSYPSLLEPQVANLLTPAERTLIAADGWGQVPVRYELLGYAYTRIADGVLVDTVQVEARYTLQVEPFQLTDGTLFQPSLPPYAQIERSNESLRASLEIRAQPFVTACPAPAGAACVPGTWLANSMYSPGTLAGATQPLPIGPNGDIVRFASDATATGTISGVTASWTIDGDGALIVSYPDSGWQQKVMIIDTLGIEFGVFNELSRSDGSRFATYSVNVKATGDFALSNAYLANEVGHFWQGEINQWVPTGFWWNPDGTRALTSYFGWQFFADSTTAINVGGVSLRDCDGGLVADDPYADLAFSQWQQSGTGIAIPRGFNGSRLRTWYPAASTVVNGERLFYVMEDERFVSGPNAGRLWFPPRINYLREIEAPWVCSN
jgi:hypothetical protein